MDKEDAAVSNFREYLRVKTVHPTPDYAGAVVFLRRMAQEINLPCRVHECAAGKPIVVMTWEGKDPALPSVLLNSHTDVVPVFPEHWRCDPFEAYKDEDGNVYGRGTQDMKCVGIQYLEAVRRLRKDGQQFLRTVHLSFVPDEEIDGLDGMAAWVETEHFKSLNLGLALDEGIASESDTFSVFYGERDMCDVTVTCRGNPGHGSRFIQGNAGEKMLKMMTSFQTYRDAQERKLTTSPGLKLGDVTTVNLTILNGGVQTNVVPDEFTAVFDIRKTPTHSYEDLDAMIDRWCKEAGEGVTYERRLPKQPPQVLTSTSKDDPWWRAFASTLERMDMKYSAEIFSAATDSRLLRQKGFPAIGFSPMNNTPVLLHDHNEYLNERVFLRGVNIYYQLIQALASVPPF